MRTLLHAVNSLVVFSVFLSIGYSQRPAGPVTGGGQQGRIPLFVGTNTLGNSSFSQNPDGSVSADLGSALGLSVTTSNSSSGSTAIFGNNTAASGGTFGVLGHTNSPAGVGVQGVSFAAGAGMHAVALNGGPALAADAGVNNTTGHTTALQAINFNSVDGEGAVIANFAGGNVIRGVGGTTQGNATNILILDASGNLFVKGNLTKGSGSFKIDHPLDPARKYLSHSFVESPDMVNLYNGMVVLGDDGEARVELPAYFEALNCNYRYQLTSIGAPGPNLYVAEEISGNHFKIAGGKPRAKVSWQVTGIRKDAYANAHRIKVEEEKSPQEVGHYLHPELFGAANARMQSLPLARNLTQEQR